MTHPTYPPPPPASARRVLGHPVTRLEDLPLVTGQGRYAGDIDFPHQLHMRVVRSAHAHGRIVSIDTAAARALPGVVAVWTNADIADLSADRFPCRQILRSAQAVSPAGAGARPRALCRRSGRRGVRGGPLSRRGRGRAGGRSTIEPLPVAAGGERPARRVRAGPQQRGGAAPPQLRRHRRGVRAPPIPSSSSTSRPAGTRACRWRPAARSAATTRRATCSSCTAPPKFRTAIARRCAGCSAAARRRCTCTKAMSAAASASAARSIPRTCWCCSPRCGCGRPVKWIEDRREHLMRANHSRQQRHLAAHRGRSPRAHPRHRRRNLPRPGRLCAHPRRQRARTAPCAC